MDISNKISPHNFERPFRKKTYFIILHTTEGPSKGSFRKLYRNGEAHYFVDTNGKILRIIDRRRIAFHCGRSMWGGLTDIDEYSIGIEVVGYHDKDITAAQYRALKELISSLQKIYKIPDNRVLTHSQVAYGAPNKWHRRSHRGRKRCGMLFANDDVRRRLGLYSKPKYDPDIRAGRLVNADKYLYLNLYGHTSKSFKTVKSGNTVTASRSVWDIARDRYKSSDTLYIFPNGDKKYGNKIHNWSKIPVGTKVIVKGSCRDNEFEGIQKIDNGVYAKDIAGDEYRSKTTYYVLPNGKVKRGSRMRDKDFNSLPKGTIVLVGYKEGGRVTARRSAFDICGKRWNFPSTFYILKDGTVLAGNTIEERNIPKNARVFYAK